ncbi:MAG TPA: CDGSH iron-sulfur domain-containing protein [Longimicrobium sp.]|nr:CDGSH iron-sulfur domain-containing protein [Longimicrobium sp.]
MSEQTQPPVEEPQPEPQVTITIRNNGPYRVEGPVRLVDADGTEYTLPGGGKGFSLCRCGASTRKPFCDGTHSKIGFLAAERAVREMEGGQPPQGQPPQAGPA